MSWTVEERLEAAAVQLDEAVARRGPTYLDDRPAPRGPARWLAAAAAAAMLAGTAAVVQWRGGEDAVDAPAASLIDGEGWERLPDAPIAPRFQHLAVSTGTGLLVWGGYSPSRPRTDGAYYSMASATWKTVPKAPLASDRGDAVGAWTGREVVVVNGIDGDVKAAAYSPASNAWRPLPDPPLRSSANMMTRALFVDGVVVVVAVSEEGEGGVRNEVAVLDPTTSSWRIGYPPPAPFGSGFDAVVSGSEVVVVGRHGMGGSSCGSAVVAVYTPGANAWRSIDGGPLATAVSVGAASVGSQVFVAGAAGAVCGADAPRAYMLDVASGTWRAGAPAPKAVQGDSRYDEPFTGRHVVLIDDDGAPWFYDPAGDQWRSGVASPLGRKLDETPWVWMGDRLAVFSGGVREEPAGGCCDPLAGGYTYTPAP